MATRRPYRNQRGGHERQRDCFGSLVSPIRRIAGSDTKLSLRLITALAALLGLYSGYLNGAGMGEFGIASVALFGLVFAVFVLVAFVTAFVV